MLKNNWEFYSSIKKDEKWHSQEDIEAGPQLNCSVRLLFI